MAKCTLEYCLALTLCQGIGPKTLTALLHKVSIDELFSLNHSQLVQLGLKQEVATRLLNVDWRYIERVICYCASHNIAIISIFDGQYPELLKQICNPPIILFCRGKVDLLFAPQLAIVGSRNATKTGQELAFHFAQQLVESNLGITSGMARGVDCAAHQGALQARSFSTIAVLGTGVDVVYPKRHSELHEKIASEGLLVSEFFPGTTPQSQHFPRRNRIISGLSLGVLIIEAEIKSGSLITARYALEQNREVFAVPGSIRNPMAQGPHHLIKQGAKLVEHVSDILEEVSFFCENSLYNIEAADIKVEEECPVLASLGFEVTNVDTLTQRTQWPVEKVLARLLDLELEDKVERVLDGYIKLARG
ncbi:DNA-processing protein DprA [Pseudoalteromonas sp. T1lg65]|uniref:DNA-processing protein DprA n=1 Tax=Pseudoalteromonas sp. T1lg65 TaxID=2077101 RepID=UPI003F79A122